MGIGVVPSTLGAAFASRRPRGRSGRCGRRRCMSRNPSCLSVCHEPQLYVHITEKTVLRGRYLRVFQSRVPVDLACLAVSSRLSLGHHAELSADIYIDS